MKKKESTRKNKTERRDCERKLAKTRNNHTNTILNRRGRDTQAKGNSTRWKEVYCMQAPRDKIKELLTLWNGTRSNQRQWGMGHEETTMSVRGL